jgi:hypothetical protein
MPLDASKIKIAGSGAVWKAPAGTALPTTSSSALDVAYKNLGYGTNGFELSQNLTTKEINAWQTLEVVRLLNTAVSRSFTFEALETNNDTVALAWGGATITAGVAGAYTLVIPDSQTTQEFVLVIDWSDGATTQRIVVPRAVLKTLPTIKYGREDAIVYSLEIMALAPTDGTKAVRVYGVDAGVSA